VVIVEAGMGLRGVGTLAVAFGPHVPVPLFRTKVSGREPDCEEHYPTPTGGLQIRRFVADVSNVAVVSVVSLVAMCQLG